VSAFINVVISTLQLMAIWWYLGLEQDMVNEASLFPVQHCRTNCRKQFMADRWHRLSSVHTWRPRSADWLS